MQQMLQNLQYQYGIYNGDIEPEHDTDYPCSCPIHIYKRQKWSRYGVQEMWSKAVMYPGKLSTNDLVPHPTLIINTNILRRKILQRQPLWNRRLQ